MDGRWGPPSHIPAPAPIISRNDKESPLMSHRTLAAAGAAAAMLLVAPASALGKDTITMSGSTSVYPLSVKLATSYVKAFPGKAGFKILQGGSDIGINDVAKGRVTIGNSSRDPLPGDPGGLVFNKIARDGVCVVTNKKNKIRTLSPTVIRSIFSGKVRNWKKVKGAKIKGAIDLITRTASSGTADAFQNIFMGPKKRIASNASAKSSNGLVRQTVASNKQAIGFVSLDFIKGTNAVGYAGVSCNLRNAKSGQYRGVRNFWMVTRGKATGTTADFLNWIKTSPAAKTQISKQWIPLK
jgi:phosphate transport system substrate-binding protein